MKSLSLAAAVATLLSVAPATASTIYTNDFESGSTTGFSGVTTITTAPTNVTKFLGQLALGTSSTLTVDTTGYSGSTIKFDLYANNSLDGDGTSYCCGPDSFRLVINGTDVVNNTFANIAGWTQNFGGAGSAGGTGSDPLLDGQLGYGYYGPDHTYHLSFALGSGINTIEFFGNTNQDVSDEGFGIDNVVVSGTAGAVPESATWAMMIGGFGAVGGALRRRRSVAARALTA